MTFIPWPIWGSQKKSLNYLSYGAHQGEIIGEKNGYMIIHCKTCILNHVANLPSEEFLADYYANQFYQFSKQDYVERYERDRAWWELHHRYTVRRALELLSHDIIWKNSAWPWQHNPTVLDIGSGPGIFLDVAKNQGFRTYGIEPNADLCGMVRNRGHNMSLGTLDTFLCDIEVAPYTPPKQYNMIHLYEVLEHVTDPEGFLDRCRSLLTDSGVLHVVVPNDYNRDQLEAQKMHNLPDWWLAPPEHLNYFEPKTLQLMVRRVGFRIVDIRTTFPLEQYLLDGFVYVGNDAVGRQCHQWRMAYEIDMYRNGDWEKLMEAYREQCADPYSGTTGREIVLTAVRD